MSFLGRPEIEFSVAENRPELLELENPEKSHFGCRTCQMLIWDGQMYFWSATALYGGLSQRHKKHSGGRETFLWCNPE